jgi:hypothetical protein
MRSVNDSSRLSWAWSESLRRRFLLEATAEGRIHRKLPTDQRIWVREMLYFLNRFSKAWRASSGRPGVGSGTAICAGC